MIRRILNFLKNMCLSAFRTTKNIVIDMFNNAEAVILLSAASIGFTAILTEIPFHITVPMWIDAPMVLPFMSVLIVLTIVTIMEKRLALTA